MIENIEFKDTSTVIIHNYPKEYTFDEIIKNLDYLFKIANKVYDNTIIAFFNNLNDINDKLKIYYPISKKSYSKYKRDDLTILKPSKCLSAHLKSNNSKDLSIALDELYKLLDEKNLKPLNIRVIFNQDTIELQIILDS